MNHKETIKEAFEKLYKQSIYHLEQKSKDLFFNKEKLVLAKEKISASSKESGCSKEVTKWKAIIHKRKKLYTTRQRVKTLKEQKENLRDAVDKIYLHYLLDDKSIRVNQKGVKTKLQCFLPRNFKNKKERKQPLLNQETCGTGNKFRSLLDSKVTVRTKSRGSSKSIRKKQSSDEKSMNDSGVFLEGDKSSTTDDAFQSNLTNKSLRKRTLLQDENKNSNIKKIKPFVEQKNSQKSNKLGSGSSKKSKYGNKLYPEVVVPKLLSQEELSSEPYYLKSKVKAKKVDFQPLFSRHCGGTWKAIVDEN